MPAEEMAIAMSSAHPDIVALREQIAQAERDLRVKARTEAVLLAEAERSAWFEVQENCFSFDWIRLRAQECLEAIAHGKKERFLGEGRLAELALRDADRADAAYTVISFSRMSDRVRYLHGSSEREAIINETLMRGGVFDERNKFMEILR